MSDDMAVFSEVLALKVGSGRVLITIGTFVGQQTPIS